MTFSSPDEDAVETLYVIVKGTYHLGTTIDLAAEQIPVTIVDRYRGDPLSSSIADASDVCLTKPGTDVLLQGSACGLAGRPTGHVEVSLRVGSIDKRLVVFGDRSWSGTVLPRITDPKPFERMPLVWERAFGGTEAPRHDGSSQKSERRNPVGIGLGGRIDGSSLPNIESPSQLIRSPGDRPPPAACGAICPHWEPRQSLAGTYDDEWLKTRAPYLPRNFDKRFLQVAPVDQQILGYLKGGEPIEITGVLPSGILRFNLPTQAVQVRIRMDSGEETKRANLDTVTILPDERRLVLVWRASLSVDKRLHRVREIEPLMVRAA